MLIIKNMLSYNIQQHEYFFLHTSHNTNNALIANIEINILESFR